MAQALVTETTSNAVGQAVWTVFNEGRESKSQRGPVHWVPDALIIIKKPDLQAAPAFNPLLGEDPLESWVIHNQDGTRETYLDRMRQPVDQIQRGIELLREAPYSRRFSINVARPWDTYSPTPPSLLEAYVQVIEDRVHITGFLRSVDAFNHLQVNLEGLTEVARLVAQELDRELGSVAAMIANLHVYERDASRASMLPEVESSEVEDYATFIEEESIPFAWRQTLSAIMEDGVEDETQWGEVFEKQSRAKYVHRCLIHIRQPLEDMVDDMAPFTRKYGEEYAMRYLLGKPETRVGEEDVRLEEDEVYTYASRARWDRNDRARFNREPIDQLNSVINQLREDPYSRRAFVTIGRPWDVTLDEPACLRSYVFQRLDEETLGLTLFMRSNDAFGATHANQYGFARLGEFVAMHTGYSKLRMTLLSANMHVYGDSWDAVNDLLRPEMPSARERLGMDD